MSDLADAVFGGQLLGHVIAGEELTHSVIADSAMTANLAEGMFVGDHSLSEVEHQIIEAKVAQAVAEEGSYLPGELLHDYSDIEHDPGFLGDLVE